MMQWKKNEIRIFDQHSGYRTIFENLGIVGIIKVLRLCREYYQINIVVNLYSGSKNGIP